MGHIKIMFTKGALANLIPYKLGSHNPHKSMQLFLLAPIYDCWPAMCERCGCMCSWCHRRTLSSSRTTNLQTWKVACHVSGSVFPSSLTPDNIGAQFRSCWFSYFVPFECNNLCLFMAKVVTTALLRLRNWGSHILKLWKQTKAAHQTCSTEHFDIHCMLWLWGAMDSGYVSQFVFSHSINLYECH